MADCVLIHYHEVALKRGHRPAFINQLVGNLRRATKDLPIEKVSQPRGRIVITLKEGALWQEMAERVSTTFGVVNFSPAFRVPPDLGAIKELLDREFRGRSIPAFRISARRADKSLPLTSPEINAELGQQIKSLTDARVDLENPGMTIFVELLRDQALIYFEKCPGPGGLPVGTGGRVACLISGGIDSPVAAYRMMKRGCPVTLVHFHSYPFLSGASQEKVKEIARLLTRYQYFTRLYLVPFGEVQRQVKLLAQAPYLVLIYRRLMARIAARIADREKAQALVTGESLGQVASQTLENIVAIQEAAPMPLLRPLIGMDKEEIIREAKQIGTYETSIIPDQDCCQLFVPKNPQVRATVEMMKKAEAGLDIEGLVQLSLENAQKTEYTFPKD